MKAYIFDFDGTLVDSMPYWAKQMTNILDEQGAQYPANIIEIITPLGNLGSAKYFRQELGVNLSEEELLTKMFDYAVPIYRDKVGFKPYVKEYLRLLKDKGERLFVLTASPHITVDPCLKRLGVYDFFEEIWTCDDFGLTKDNTKIYFAAAKKIGVTAGDITFFDDNIIALTTAAKAGCKTVGVYDKSGENFVHQMREKADLYITSFSELL